MFPTENGYFNLLHAAVREQEARASAQDRERADLDADARLRADIESARRRLQADGAK